MAKTGPFPAVTKGLDGFPICSNPLMYLVDSPGIMHPTITDNEVGLKLAITGSIRQEAVGVELMADYMLY